MTILYVMSSLKDIENIPNYEEYIRQKAIGGFSCTYDIIPESVGRKRRICSMDEIAVLRTVRTHDTATEKQLADILGKSEEEVKALIATLMKEGLLKRNNDYKQDYWELV